MDKENVDRVKQHIHGTTDNTTVSNNSTMRLYDPSKDRERDYWRKVYAGRNLAQCVEVFGYDAFNAPEKFAEYCDNLAIALVNRMFPEDQS